MTNSPLIGQAPVAHRKGVGPKIRESSLLTFKLAITPNGDNIIVFIILSAFTYYS
jgi:hypothetical protein